MNLLSFLQPQTIGIFHSEINGEIKVIESFGKRILLVNDAEQSGGTITGMWDKTIRAIKQWSNGAMEQCLILGLGGGTVINLLKKYYPDIKITAIEFDPMMIDIYKKYFQHNSWSVNIIQTDVFSWVNRKKKDKYDLIIYDVYVGKYNPSQATKGNFLENLKSFLNSHRMILFNRHYQRDEADYQKFFRVCEKVFSEVKLILSYPYSRILLLR